MCMGPLLYSVTEEIKKYYSGELPLVALFALEHIGLSKNCAYDADDHYIYYKFSALQDIILQESFTVSFIFPWECDPESVDVSENKDEHYPSDSNILSDFDTIVKDCMINQELRGSNEILKLIHKEEAFGSPKNFSTMFGENNLADAINAYKKLFTGKYVNLDKSSLSFSSPIKVRHFGNEITIIDLTINSLSLRKGHIFEILFECHNSKAPKSEHTDLHCKVPLVYNSTKLLDSEDGVPELRDRYEPDNNQNIIPVALQQIVFASEREFKKLGPQSVMSRTSPIAGTIESRDGTKKYQDIRYFYFYGLYDFNEKFEKRLFKDNFISFWELIDDVITTKEIRKSGKNTRIISAVAAFAALVSALFAYNSYSSQRAFENDLVEVAKILIENSNATEKIKIEKIINKYSAR